MNGLVNYGTGKGCNGRVSPTYDLTTKKGNTCKVYVCSEYDENIMYNHLGERYELIWHSRGEAYFGHKKEINEVISDERIEDAVDEFVEKYGKGRMYILKFDVVVRA